MKQLTVLFAFLTLVIMSCGNCCADIYTSNNFEYELSEDGTAILGLYVGEEGADVIIPYEIDGHMVMGASDNPFWQTPVASITVPDDHPYFMIINGVLYGKPDGKLIYYPPHAPSGVLVLPKGIKEFGNHAFYHCTNLQGIVYDE